MKNTKDNTSTRKPVRSGNTINTSKGGARTHSNTRKRTKASSYPATRSTNKTRHSPPCVQVHPAVRYIALPLIAAAVFVLLGLAVSCAVGYPPA